MILISIMLKPKLDLKLIYLSKFVHFNTIITKANNNKDFFTKEYIISILYPLHNEVYKMIS